MIQDIILKQMSQSVNKKIKINENVYLSYNNESASYEL